MLHAVQMNIKTSSLIDFKDIISGIVILSLSHLKSNLSCSR